MIGNEHMGVTEEQLNGLGNRWAKRDGEVRWYVNDWMDAIGMEVVYYNTGNISDVYYHGGPASHGEGHPSNYWFKKSVAGTKVWIDIEGRVHVDYCKDAGVERDIIAKVGERIQAAIDAQAPVEVVTEVCAQAEAQAPVEEAEGKLVAIMFVEREDGETAKVDLPIQAEDEDVWTAIGREYPSSYDLMDERSIVPGYVSVDRWDARFRPGEDSELTQWLKEGMANAADFGYDYDLDSDLRWNHDRTEAELTVFGTVGGRDAEIVFRAAASEWDELRGLFGRGDEDALAAWHLAHLESVGWSE